jgi:putative heme iron utilization protein
MIRKRPKKYECSNRIMARRGMSHGRRAVQRRDDAAAYFYRSKFKVRSTNTKTNALFEMILLFHTDLSQSRQFAVQRRLVHHNDTRSIMSPLAHRDAIRGGLFFRVESPHGDTLESIRLA